MLYVLVVIYLTLSSFEVESQKSVKVHSYDSLVTYLTKGATVWYVFNTSSCEQPSMKPEEDNPVFGGEIKMFVSTPNSQYEEGQTIFSHVQYSDENITDLNEEIQSMWILNDSAMVFWGKPGFFVNNTDDLDGTMCNWTVGEGSVWVKPHKEQKRLESFKEIQTLLTSGEEVRWAVNMSGCKCPPDPDECGNGSFGNAIKDFKIMKDGSISFSSSMTFIIPLSWQYVRLVAFGHIYENNTAYFMISYLDPTTWQDAEDDMVLCSISADPSSSGAKFFTTRK
ncbi:uncharacterized protein LOC125648488 [Ostrea edulis]|uniref:uncharacterized protein LOC125648488 n=1 Tax=Ostrea edulis TaxID=37623 RepID=UPI0024AF535D|nr:uncharacterized protein LOC125648488 [Ostrea edulis]XP_048731573.2 uncharacterized protein LOC125648488 [Ostrea edulis]